MRTEVGGVLLAAGESSRFGERNKLLASVDGDPVVRRAAKRLSESAVGSVVAVLGHEATRVGDALDGVGVELRTNHEYPAGQSTSVATGIAAADEREWDATVFALGDMPFVDASTIDSLVDAYRSGEGTVLAPAYEGTRGNPVLFDRCHYETLAGVTGDRGGRELVRSAGRQIAVDDAGVCRDIDRPSDLE